MVSFFEFLFILLVWIGTATSQPPATVSSYAPVRLVNCPNTSVVRAFWPQEQYLNANEQDFITQKQSSFLAAAWDDWIGSGSQIGYNFSALQAHLPKVGIALGGGGYRGAQYGAGVLSGIDARNASAKAVGTGGLLQVASYLSASSGGSWLAGSLYMNNWPTIRDLVYGNGHDLSGWLLNLSPASPEGIDLNNQGNQAFLDSVLGSVSAKAHAGFDTSFTDVWARMISYHFLNGSTIDNFYTNGTSHGAGQLWSNMPTLSSYTNHTIPYPIVVADSRPAKSGMTGLIPLSSVVYEITPHEFGSWDPGLSAMVDLTYAGTIFVGGEPLNTSSCVTGFDQAGFVMGTSASFFNKVFNRQNNPPTVSGFSNSDGPAILHALSLFYERVHSSPAIDAAIWPNPFFNITSATFQDTHSPLLELLDGSSNSEGVPLGSLFVNVRALDTIVAVDGSADNVTYNWPNGTSLLTTSSRISNILSASHRAFPPIPSNSIEFITTGVNQRPTFFGCDPIHSPPEYPLLIYIPNSPPLSGDDPSTNTDTFELTYTSTSTQVFLDQVHANTIGGFTPNSNTPDPNWGKCLQCAAVDRARLKFNPFVSRSTICQQCFNQYCYDPNHPPSQSELPNRRFAFVNPDPQGVEKVKDFVSHHKASLIGGIVAILVVIGALLGFIFWNRRRKEIKSRYFRVDELRDDDEPWREYDSVNDHYELPEHRRIYT